MTENHVMTEAHEAHLQRLKDEIIAELDAKYRAGQVQHGGHLWLKEGMLDRAIEEVLDLAVYLYTMREQSKRTYDELQAGAVLTGCRKCGHSYYMTHPHDTCRECRATAHSIKG